MRDPFAIPTPPPGACVYRRRRVGLGAALLAALFGPGLGAILARAEGRS